MSRRKQARPIRHLDDIDGTEDAANLTEEGARLTPDEEDDEEVDCCVCPHCKTKFASEAECDDHVESCGAKRASDSSNSADGDNEDRVNNNDNRTGRGRRRKRDEDDDLDELEDGSDDQVERVRRPSCGDEEAEDNGENERRVRAKKPARDTDVSQPAEESDSGNNGSINPYHPSLFPYAATLANANVTLDALQSTKMAIAQFAANAMANNGQQSPQALQELAVLQSTLYALQQQQIMQLQLIQQLQQQLQINQPEGSNGTSGNGGKESINLNMFGFGLDGSGAADELRERDPSLESSSRTSTPGHVTANQSRTGESNEAESSVADISKRASELLAASSALLRKEERSRSENKADDSDRREAKKSPSKSREEGDGQTKSSLFPSTSTWSSTTQSTASTSYSFSTANIMSQLPGGSLADTILQASDPPPNPEGPSTLEMLQRTAQQVLNNASQGLLATNLADELGFRTNGSASGNSVGGEGGKKDQLFKHRCRYCGKVFSSDSALQIHIRSHTGERPYKCNICGNRFTTKGNLKVHFQRHAARFPHIKMNPHPVPEHLDKFHPPLLAQLDLDESKMSPSGAPFGPVTGATSAPPNHPSRDNRAPSPIGAAGFLRPNLNPQIPASVSSFFGRGASNGNAGPGGDLMPGLRPMFPGLSVAGLKEAAASFLSSAAAAAAAGQDLPENLSSKHSSAAIVDSSAEKKESAKSSTSSEPDIQQIKTERADQHNDQSIDDEMDFDDSAQAEHESHHQAETEAENERESAADNKRDEMLSGRNSRAYSHDESSVDSNFSGQEQELADDNINISRHEDHKDNSLDGPENLSGRRSANSSPASTVNSISGTAGRGDSLPFSPVNFGQFGPPGGPLRFPMGFPMPPMGAMANFNPAALAAHGAPVRGEQGANPNGTSGITLHTPVGPIVLPPDVDPAKDPAIYTNLLPRPGSNDNAWESLIEVTKTSETAKLQHLVDNIENKLVDPNQCVVCHRVLSCKSALQMHYRTHTGERPFKCKICGRAFTTKGNLKTHMGVHRAKPPARMLHMCPVCHKKFTNGLVLQQHIRLHTGEPTDLTPEQIQAAELREFPHPFPFMGGFHPFLQHGPFSPLHSIPGMGPSMGTDGGSDKPLSFSLKSDNGSGGKDGESREDGDLQTEGSSSEALSPASSTANEMNHANRHAELLAQMSRANEALFKKYQQDFIDVNDESVNRSDLISECDSEIGGKLEKDFRSEALPSPDDSKEDIEESLSQQKSSRHFSPARSSTPEHSHKTSQDVKCSTNATTGERSSSSASLLSGPLQNHRSASTETSGRSKGSKQPNAAVGAGPLSGHPPLSPLDLTAAGRPFFPGGYNILPPGPGALPSSVSPGSALSSLTSAVMTSPSFNPLNLPISAPGRGNTTCNICFKTFACHSALEIHYRSHTKERPFKCSICDRGFSTKGNMKQHMMTHKNRDGTPISADLLKSLERSRPSSFRDAANNKSNSSDDNNMNDDSHKDGHSSSASSTISPPKEHCLSLTIQHSRDGATLPLKAISPIDAATANCNGTSALLSANRTSSTSAPFRSSAAHKKRSTGLPKHLCHTCDKNFSSSSSLQIHMRTHTGDRPFQCPVCAKAFTTRGNLKVHMGTHSEMGHSNGVSSSSRSSSSRRGRRMSVDLLTTTNWTMMGSKAPHPGPPASPSNPANSGACHRPSRPGFPVPFAPALHHLSAFTGLRQPGLLFPSHLVPAYLNAASASEENMAAAYRQVNSMSSRSYLNGDLTKNEAATTSGNSSDQKRRRANDDDDVDGRHSPVIASTPPTSQPWMWHPMDLNQRQAERNVEADDTDTETDRKDLPAFSTPSPRCEVIRAK